MSLSYIDLLKLLFIRNFKLYSPLLFLTLYVIFLKEVQQIFPQISNSHKDIYKFSVIWKIVGFWNRWLLLMVTLEKILIDIHIYVYINIIYFK